MICDVTEVKLDEKVSNALNVLRDAGFDFCIYKLRECEDGHIRGLRLVNIKNDTLKVSVGMVNGILGNLVDKEEFDPAMFAALMLSCIEISTGVKFSEIEISSVINIVAGAELKTEEESADVL